MKYIFITLLVCLIACSPKNEKKQEADSSEVTITAVSYGENISPEDVTDIRLVDQLMAENDSVQVKLKGEIDKTCKMKGCWMTVKTGDSSTMRVTFKDYGFFVPKEGQEGKSAIFDGILTKKVTSVETLKHFAQDEGRSALEIESITEPKKEYTFVASGVLIED